MNERIQELLKKAQNIAAKNHTPGGRAYEREIYVKFAELIVRECVSMCESVDEADIRYRYDYRRGVLDCADTLRQHFGVE